jgi:hypothetical protein
MGILKLMDFIKSKFPGCIVSRQPQEYSNKIVAIDASNTMYQFLIKTQSTVNNYEQLLPETQSICLPIGSVIRQAIY